MDWRFERREDFAKLRDEFGVTVKSLARPIRESALQRGAPHLPVDNRLHTVMYARLLIGTILPAGIERASHARRDTFVIAPIELRSSEEMDGKPVATVSDSGKAA